MRRMTWILLAVLVIGGAVYAWAATSRSSTESGQAIAQESLLMPVERSTITRTLTYSGSLEPIDDLTVTAGFASWVKEILVSKGDVVRAGDVIARLDDTDARLEVLRARREYDQARLDSPPGVVEEKRLSLLSAERRLDGMTIVAPFDGIVADVLVREGASVNAQASIVRVVDPSAYKVTLTVDQKDLAHIAVGQEVYVTPTAISGLTLLGRVEHIDFLPANTDSTTTYAVTVVLDTPVTTGRGAPMAARGSASPRPAADVPTVNLAEQLRPGLSVDAEIVVANAQDVLVVPIAAIVEVGRQQLVTRVTPDGVEETVPVETGITDGLLVEIRSGLDDGDRIVMNNYMLFERLSSGASRGPGGGGGRSVGTFGVPAGPQRVIFGR